MGYRIAAHLPILAALLTSCGALESVGLRQKSYESEKPILGSLESEVRAIHRSEYVSACDQKSYSQQIAIARSLDRKALAIKKITEEPSDDPQYRTEQIGPLTIRKQIEIPEVEDAWQSYSRSWEDIFYASEQLDSDSIDHRWVKLNSAVRAMLVDDRRRLLFGINVYLMRNEIPNLLSANKKVKKCLEKSSCTTPKLSDAEKQLLTTNRYYSYHWNRLVAEESDGREDIEKLSNRLNYDSIQHTFKKNEGVYVKKSVLHVPLLAGELAGFESNIDLNITPIWNASFDLVAIDWGDPDNAFKIEFDKGTGNRAFVSYSDKAMFLASGVLNRSIAHEFGHVLGLPDEYYTTWSDDTCKYTIEYNPYNLMSSSQSGVVTEKIVQILRAEYGVE